MATDLKELAQRYHVSLDAVQTLQEAVRRGHGKQAQFSHKDLGGMGQWSAGGLTQVGDMFNADLKNKVDALCRALAQMGGSEPPTSDSSGSVASNDRWPGRLGRPAATGAQNGMRYAYFPETRHIAVETDGKVTIYDSGDHRISGVSQQQSGRQELSFSSQLGTVQASDLPVEGTGAKT